MVLGAVLQQWTRTALGLLKSLTAILNAMVLLHLIVLLCSPALGHADQLLVT
ncbi:MAG: hypothetical protein ACI901_001589 [Octadecabacter sp.]|jgi:hypothetical protein